MMMIERHYDDAALVTMLASGVADPHISSCIECTEKLESFRLVEDALRDAATWDKREYDATPNPATIATLRTFAETMAAEDAAAETYLADLLAGPRETWMAKLAAHPEYRTAGMVRRLIAATDRALDTMPADAVEITALAAEIAEHLDPTAHRPDTLARLRGAAWRERAYALFYVGDIVDAQYALARASNHLASCVLPEYELARLMVVRGLVFRTIERYDDAIQTVRTAATTFSEFADTRRSASARLAEALTCYKLGRFDEALRILQRAERQLRSSDDAETHARVLGNIGYCYWKMNRIDEALRYHDAAANVLDALGIKTESARTRWNVASILAGEGRIDEALGRLDAVHAEFQDLGMSSVATLVKLEEAELLLTRGLYAEVEGICAVAMQEFGPAGFAHTERALTALALMKEAAANRSATPSLVRNVREYLRKLPEEPDLIFLPVPAL